jgi:hypothetical protein
VVSFPELLGEGHAHERADDDGGGRHGRVDGFLWKGDGVLDGIGSDTM